MSRCDSHLADMRVSRSGCSENSLVQVFSPATPSAISPWSSWKARKARSVLPPNRPSGLTG